MPGQRWLLPLFVVAVMGLAVRWWLSDDQVESIQSAHSGSIRTSVALDVATQEAKQIAAAPAIINVAGVVRDGTGVNLRGAQVVLEQNGIEIGSVTSDERGRFAFTAPPGALSVRAEAPTFGVARVQTVAPTTDLVVTLYPGNRIAGQVLIDGSLQPVANIQVEAQSESNKLVSRVDHASARTNSSGRFEFDSLPSGVWALTAEGSGFSGTSRIAITVGVGERVDDVVIAVTPASSVEGRFVVGLGETPCVSGRLEIQPEARVQRLLQQHRATGDQVIITERDETSPIYSASVGKNGAVAVKGVPYGVYRLSALCDDFRIVEGPTTIELGGEVTSTFTWKFVESVPLVVKVVSTTGRPLPGIAVDVATLRVVQGEERALALRRKITDSQGVSRFGALGAGRYQVQAKVAATKGKSSATETIVWQAGEAPPEVTLTMSGAQFIRIRSFTASNVRSSRMLFFATSSNADRYDAVYQGDGQFTIGPIPPGRYLVFAYDNKNAKIPLSSGSGSAVSVIDGRDTDIDFHFDPPTATLEGRVVDSSGAPIAGAFVRAVSTTLDEDDELFSVIQLRMHGGQEIMTDDSGQFHIAGLDARGHYDVYVDRPSGEHAIERNVSVGEFVHVALSR